jgi:replicative DNA helicase
MVDYLQIVGADARDEYSRTVDVSRKLALLKREGFTVVAAAQLNRSVEDRDDFAPRMSDFKSSGQIEQDTDIALSCVYDDMVEGKPKFLRKPDTNFRIHIHKSRQSGFLRPVVYCVFDAASQQFADCYEPEPEVFHEFDDYSPTQQILELDEEV